MPFSASAAGALILNSIVWGMSWLGMRALQNEGVHPIWATGIIFVCCTIAMLAIQPRSLRQMRGQPQLLWIALAAGLTNVCFNSAVAFGDVVRVVLLFYLMPVWAVLLARVILKEAMTARALARIALGLAGAAVVLYRPELGVPLPHSLADWVAILGGITFAANNVMVRKLSHVPDGARAVAMFGGGAVLALVLGVTLMPFGLAAPAAFSTHALATLALWTVLFMGSNMCLQYGAARLPANLTAVIMLTEILVAAASSWWLGAAQLGWQDVLGGALIIAAPWVIRERKSAAVQPA